MKRLILSLLMTASLSAAYAIPAHPFDVAQIDPPYWWTAMANDTLQLMVTGQAIALPQVQLAPYEGVEIIDAPKLDNIDYRLIYLKVSPEAKPGTLQFTFNIGPRKKTVEYELRARDNAKGAQGFTSADVLYLIMPDRFARGGKTTDAEAAESLEFPTMVDRADLNARHGGNIAGMQDHLDYIDRLGVTAVWVNPVLENDMPGGSYHGYATTDYYRIDPRFGTNDEWNTFVRKAHDRDIKVIMDMIFNHSGSNHEWFKKRPTKDWYNFPDSFVQTNFRLSTVHDPYVSQYDKKRTVDGWFVRSMPDLNQRNPHLMKYLIQNSIWWIESSKIDGIRMDTYPYADEQAMAEWNREVLRQYPDFKIVGECWYANEGGEAYWQKGSRVNPNGDTELPAVMDFVLSLKARNAFSSQTNAWEGLNEIYDHLALDYLFPDPANILTFLDNHDTDRFLLEEPADLGWWKQAQTFLLTSRGIPQIYYGTEILMNGARKDGGDGNVRRDFPGGFSGDTTDAFSAKGRTPQQNEAFDFMSKLLNWRRGNDVIAKGTLRHFMPENGLYVYERRLGDKVCVVMMNGTDAELTVQNDRYAEILLLGTKLRDMLSGKDVVIEAERTFAPREILILEN
ncbi:MAG: glycoside hydrolase family 13 protein [Muribaculaceae bacterium]|nr:glycoside hydrolase family 13 protein [Muribaculaceae bacterium]